MDRLGYLAICLGVMILLLPLRNRLSRGQYKSWGIVKTATVLISIIVVGSAGAMVMYRIECGDWGGTSFFGSVFLIPIVFPLLALCLRIPYGELMDFTAPNGCVVLMIMRVLCLQAGCCEGRLLPFSWDGYSHYFPSREVELATAGLMLIALLIVEKKHGLRRRGYALFLICFGVTQLIWKPFRRSLALVFGVPGSYIWSVIAILSGAGSLLYIRYRNRKQAEAEEA